MEIPDFIQFLTPQDIETTALWVQRAYEGSYVPDPPYQVLHFQILQSLQELPLAWGFVAPFLNHKDPKVQFFGAHTVHLKITRDWETISEDGRLQLIKFVPALTAHAAIAGHGNPVLRKLFVAIAALAVKLASRWPNWITECMNHFQECGVTNGVLFDFLCIIVEEMETAYTQNPDLGPLMQQAALGAARMVFQAIKASLTDPRQARLSGDRRLAWACFEAWQLYLSKEDVDVMVQLKSDLFLSDLNALSLNVRRSNEDDMVTNW